ncbi:MAG: carboxypeptidase-like regulatory domain-containing protein, partial [Planctomycetota bacterium]
VVEVVDATTLSPIEGARVRVLSWQYQDRVANSMLVEQNARGTWYPLGTGGLDSSETAAPFPWLPDLSSRPLKGQHLVDGLTDTNGLLPAFTFDPKFGDLVVGATGYASLRKSSYKVMSAQVSRIRIELEPAHRISGQILDSNGSQIRFPDFAAVTGYALFPADSKKALSFKMSVNDAGAFEADIGACDLLRIEVHLGGFEPWTKDLAQSDLTHSSVDVHLQRIAFVAGYLVDAKGRAVTQAIVRSSYLGSGRSQVMTSPNAEGFFRISVPKGGIKLEIESEAFAKFETSSPLLNDEEQRITLLPGGRGGISGRILDGGGRPMSGHKVTLHYLSGPLRHDDSTVTNEDGHYQLDDLRVGLYDLACPRSDTKNFRRPDDSKPFEITIARLGIVVRANEVTRDVDLKIGAGGSVSGRVFVKASRISLLDPQDKERVLASRRLGANNSYRFDGIPAGRYALVLGFGDRIELIEIVAGQNLERDLGAAPGRLSAVVARQGQVLANCRVMVAQIIEGQLSAQSLRTDEKGQVEAANLTLGTALLRVQDLDARSAIFTLEVTSTPRQQGLTWPSASVEIDCGDLAITPTATISFYVTTINGIPLAKVAPAAQRRVARVKVDKKIMLIEELNAADYHIVFDNGSETKELNTTLTQNQNTLNL